MVARQPTHVDGRLRKLLCPDAHGIEGKIWLIRRVGAIVLDAVLLHRGERTKIASSLGSVEVAEHELAQMDVIVCLTLADTKHRLVLLHHLPHGISRIAKPKGIASSLSLHPRLDDGGKVEVLKLILVERHVLHVIINIDR